MAHLQDQRTQAYTVVNMLSTAEAGLRQNVQDPLVLMVREETKREILALADRERELQERITGHDRTSYRFLIPDAQGDVDKFEREYKSTRLEAVKKKLDDAKGRLSGLERNKATAESALADVRKSMADVRKRQDEVEKRAMIP
jgi:chromosome segregation ATPase